MVNDKQSYAEHYSMELYYGASSVTVIAAGKEIADPVSNPGCGCVLIYIIALEKDMNSSPFPASYGKIAKQTGFFSLWLGN